MNRRGKRVPPRSGRGGWTTPEPVGDGDSRYRACTGRDGQGKRGYASDADAKRSIGQYLAHGGTDRLRAYKCRHCAFHHIGRTEPS